MVWFWGGSEKRNDPTKSLDPDLKQFLDDQQPKPYQPAEPAPAKTEEKSVIEAPSVQQDLATESEEDFPLPKESLFQDGRYKHLWKTYQPQVEVEADNKTPVERIMSARKDRRSATTRAAMENCAFEEDLQRRCLGGSGLTSSFRSRMNMCHEETKTYNRCYQLQSKFLQALGYMSRLDTTDEEEERIQMHADKLYHRMMDYEEQLDIAHREGKPVPPLTSIFDHTKSAPTVEQLKLPQSMEAKLQTPLADLPPHERELATRAALGEAKANNQNFEEFYKYTTSMNEERKKRQSWLIKALGEPVGKFLIPDPPPPQDRKPNEMGPERLEEEIWQTDKRWR